MMPTAMQNATRRRLLLYPTVGGGAVAYHDASSLTLPAGATIARAGSAMRLWHASAWASAVYEVVSADTARFERTPEGDVGLLIEGARTNLATHPSDAANAVFTKTAIVATSLAATAPTGGTDAFVLREDAATAQHRMHVDFASQPATTNFAESCFFKRHTSGTRNAVMEMFSTAFASGSTIIINPDDGTVASAPTGTIGNGVLAFPSGWYRPWLAKTTDADGGTIRAQLLLASGTTTNYAGDNASNIAGWQLQVEAGNFPSSPIQGTRNADVYAQTATAPAGGGFAVELIARTAPGKAGDQVLWMLAVDANNWCAIKRNSSGAIVAEMRSGGTTVSVTGATIADGTKFKVAASFAANSLGLAVNGVAATRNTSCAYPIGSLTVHTVGHDRAGANHWFGHAIRWPKGADWLGPRSDSELQALTA